MKLGRINYEMGMNMRRDAGSCTKYNIFWFIIDSVRTFRTGRDDRDRLDIMDKFANDAIEFTNAYTSAPSSLLAAGALFTGLPSVYIARHYSDWKFKNNEISTIRTLVEEYGYTSFPLIDSREGREKYQFLLPPFGRNYLPKGYKLSNFVWTNKELTHTFEHILKSRKWREPIVTIFWYDCRRDPNTSKYVEDALNLIKEHGYFDNSIIIMNSDHGYPDPSTNLNESFFKDLGHDMVLTEDNIKTPLLLKYPQCPTNKKIPNVVGHVDIMPTIFDLLNIPMKQTQVKFAGKSLLPIIKGEEDRDVRVVRTDTRLQMDVSRITSFRTHSLKYVYFHDAGSEALFNLSVETQEEHNLLEENGKDYEAEITRFRALRKEYDIALFDFHQSELRRNAEKGFMRLRKKYSGEAIRVLIVSKATLELLVMLTNLIHESFTCENVDLIYSGNDTLSQLKVNNIYKVEEVCKESVSALRLHDYTLVLYLTHNSRRVFLKDDIVKAMSQIRGKYFQLMNFNFELFDYFSFRSLFTYLKLFFDWEIKGYFYKQEPAYFFKDVAFYIRHTITTLRRAKKSKDLASARETMDFRNHHLKTYKKGLERMDEGQMEYELDRISKWTE